MFFYSEIIDAFKIHRFKIITEELAPLTKRIDDNF